MTSAYRRFFVSKNLISPISKSPLNLRLESFFLYSNTNPKKLEEVVKMTTKEITFTQEQKSLIWNTKVAPANGTEYEANAR